MQIPVPAGAFAARLPPGPGGGWESTGGPGTLLCPPPPSPSVGCLGEVFAAPAQTPRQGLGGARADPDGESAALLPLQSQAPALQGYWTALRCVQLPASNGGEAQPCRQARERAGQERGARGVGSGQPGRPARPGRGGRGEEERSAGEQNKTKSPVKILC